MPRDSDVEKLIAKSEILNAVHAYIRGQDRLDAALQRSAFHDDAYVNYGDFEANPDDYVAFAQKALTEQFESSQHLLGQVTIEVDGQRAKGEVYFIAWHREGRGEDSWDVFMSGRYIDEYENRDAGWKISARREIMDWARRVKAADTFLSSHLGLHWGRRDGRDFSEVRDWPQGAQRM